MQRLRMAIGRMRGSAATKDPFSLGDDWHYHTIRDRDDRPLWDGQYDLYPLWPHFGIPDVLSGQRVLDIGTATGYFAFECEKRGADVVATELTDLTQWDTRADVPPGGPDIPRRNQEDFRTAAEALGGRVQLRYGSISEPMHEELGTFDWVIFGALLTHVQDPIRCLQNVRALTRGRAVVVSSYAPLRTDLSMRWMHGGRSFDWWFPSRRLVPEMLRAAGFQRVEETGRFVLRHRKGYRQRQACWHAFP